MIHSACHHVHSKHLQHGERKWQMPKIGEISTLNFKNNSFVRGIFKTSTTLKAVHFLQGKQVVNFSALSLESAVSVRQ